MPPAPHNDLDPTAGDHTQEEGREESYCDLRVKHHHAVVKHWSCDLGLIQWDHGMFSTIISQTSCPLPCNIALAL
jgi:hypothetical protein